MRKLLILSLAIILAGCAGAGKKTSSLEYLAKGEMYHKTGDLKNAFKNLNKAVEVDHNNIEAYASRGALLYSMGDYKNALTDFTVVIYHQPYRADAYAAAGAAMAELGDYLNAQEVLLHALKLNPSHIAARVSLGGMYLTTQNYAAAIEEYTTAITLQPAGDIYFMRGIAYQQYGKIEEAHKDFKAAGLKEDEYPKIVPAPETAD